MGYICQTAFRWIKTSNQLSCTLYASYGHFQRQDIGSKCYRSNIFLERLPQQLCTQNNYTQGRRFPRSFHPAYSSFWLYQNQTLWISFKCFQKEIFGTNMQSFKGTRTNETHYWAANTQSLGTNGLQIWSVHELRGKNDCY